MARNEPMLDNSLSNKERQISHLKIIIAVVILVALGTVIGLNYKPIKTYVKETGQGVLEYAKHADPFTTGCILGLVGVADSSFLSLPEGNDFLIVYFSIMKPAWIPWFVLVSALGSTFGSLMLFIMGRKGGKLFLRKRFEEDRVGHVQSWFRKYDIWAILIPCIVPPPMPFKLFVLTAGVLRFSYGRFLSAVFLGRLFRYGVWGLLAYLFRDYIRYFMTHYLLEVGIIILIAMVLMVMGYFLYRRRKRRNSGGESTVQDENEEVNA